MPRKYIFADESGNFDFSRAPSASRYFILTTVSVDDCSVGSALLELRRELAWRKVGLNSEFHATEDAQQVRDEVFAVLGGLNFRVDATILEKAKAQPHVRDPKERFYKIAWYYHLKHVAKRAACAHDELLVVGASVGIRKERGLFRDAVHEVVGQVAPMLDYRTAYWAAGSDPCLQVADYCSWAIQRKWERGDSRSYALIAKHICSEYELWKAGSRLYY